MARVEGAGHREALVLVQGVVMVMQMVVVVESRFGGRIGTGTGSVANGIFHKRVHVGCFHEEEAAEDVSN